MERTGARVDRRVGAEPLGHVEPLLVDVHRDHPAARELRHLERVEPHPADADQRHRGAGSHVRALRDRVIRRRDGVAEDARVLERDVAGDLAEVHARCLHVFGEPTVDAEPVLPHVRTQRVAADATELAAAAGQVEVHDDPVPRREPADVLTDFLDLTGDLVAHDERDHAEAHAVGADLHVGAAHADGADADQRLVRRDGRCGDFFLHERATELFEDERLHRRPPARLLVDANLGIRHATCDEIETAAGQRSGRIA